MPRTAAADAVTPQPSELGPSASQAMLPNPSEVAGDVPSLDLTLTSTGGSTTMSVRLAALDKRLRDQVGGTAVESPDLLPLHDAEDGDGEGAPEGAGLRLCLSESGYDQTSGGLRTTGALTTTTTTGASPAKPFNPHVTMGGTVHAGKGLAVGATGVRGAGVGKSFILNPDDFAPLPPASAAASATASPRADGPEGRRSSESSQGGETPDKSVLLGRGASGSVRLMVHVPTGAAVAVKTIATDERKHFDSILSEVRALMDAKQLFADALGATGSAPALSAPATGAIILDDSDDEIASTAPPGSTDGEAKDRSAETSPTAAGREQQRQQQQPHRPKRATSAARPQAGFIVDFLGAWSRDGDVHIAMECMAGSLADIGRVPEPIAAKMGLMLFTGLHVLHRHLGLLHRDIKPTNVLFDGSGVVKLADFGVSSKLDPAKLEQTKTFVGSVMYMSPERVLGDAYSYPSDVWAMALTVAELVAGRHPFKAYLGPEAFQGGHEGRFWKLCDFYTVARRFDALQSAATRLAAVPHATEDEKADAARAAAELRAFAAENGVRLDDPRVPADAGFVARACAVDEELSADLLAFLAACLRTEPHERPTAFDVLGFTFIARHHRDVSGSSDVGSAQADMDDVRAWLLTSVPHLCETQSTREAAAATAKRVRDGASPPGQPAQATPGADADAARREATASPPPALTTKKSSVRARLTSLADEPVKSPADATNRPRGAGSPREGAVYADEEPKGVSGGCCMAFGGTRPTVVESEGDSSSEQGSKKKKKKNKNKDDSGCVVA